ncbi:hypothetical protein PENTCL1PPCAC_11832, partial [Pristionchus entomophagus]
TSNAILVNGIERDPLGLNHDDFFIIKKLSQGVSNEIYSADYISEKGSEKVVVKIMKGEFNHDSRNTFLKEARMMRKLEHRNIVKMLGIAVHDLPLMIMMEYCEGGAMSSYLMKNGKAISVNEKKRFVIEAAEGMAYLEEKPFIHRDIAARNCLLYGETNTVKISDLAMSHDKGSLHDEYLEKTRIKWLAPEVMQNSIYSLKTDVWSFGGLV